MKRRALIGAGGLWMLGRPALAQPARKIVRIGLAATGPTSDLAGPQPGGAAAQAFLRGMAELGYVYGQHYVTEARGADGKPDRYPVIAAELVALQPDVIVGAGPTLPALKQARARFPSSCRPPSTPSMRVWCKASDGPWRAVQVAAQSRGWKLHSLEINDAAELGSAFKSASPARAGGVLVLTGQISFPNRQRIAELAARSRLPAMYDMRPYAAAGGLISYGADLFATR